jgi:two-component system sensor histidine kinase HydH
MKRMKKLYPSPAALSLLAGVALSVVLSWFAFAQYGTAVRMTGENLRGLALSLAAAVESVSARDPSFQSLNDFQSPEIAYFAIMDRNGTILFHSNSALVGRRVSDSRFAPVFDKGEFSADRVRLGTGEEIYESNSPLHVSGRTLALRLALHTYRADSVVRMARIGLAVLLSLIASAWAMGFLLRRFALREETFRKEMARGEHLAKLGQMGAVIAHEIRNPLAGIKGYAQLLHEKAGPGEDGQFAGLIVRQALRLEEMVNELLAFTNTGKDSSEPIEICDALERSVAVISPEADESGVSIESSMESPLVISGNCDRLEQLFINLFRNALQAMPGGGRLGITGYRLGNKIEVLVSDTGHGIEPNNLQHIFEPFFTTKARGTGLGLAICKKISEDYNGNITVESIPGRGTTFRIIFPAQAG